MDTQDEESKEENVSIPPFFKEWKSWYILVIGELLLLIVLFYWFTKAYS